MANICTFTMRIRGTREACNTFLAQGVPCYDCAVTRTKESDKDMMVQLDGECRWSVKDSMLDGSEMDLQQRAAQEGLEIEVFGYDKTEPSWLEHYHICGKTCDTATTIREWLTPDEYEEEEYSDEEKSKYDYIEEYNMYILKDEYSSQLCWDDEQGKMEVIFSMKF